MRHVALYGRVPFCTSRVAMGPLALVQAGFDDSTRCRGGWGWPSVPVTSALQRDAHLKQGR